MADLKVHEHRYAIAPNKVFGSRVQAYDASLDRPTTVTEGAHLAQYYSDAWMESMEIATHWYDAVKDTNASISQLKLEQEALIAQFELEREALQLELQSVRKANTQAVNSLEHEVGVLQAKASSPQTKLDIVVCVFRAVPQK